MLLRNIWVGGRPMLQRPSAMAVTRRAFQSFGPRLNNNNNSNGGGSLFGDITTHTDRPDSTLNQLSSRVENATAPDGKDQPAAPVPKSDQQVVNDPELLEFIKPKATPAPELLLSPLKQRLYAIALKTGGYDPNKVYELDGKKYQLKLTAEELKALEPSLYLKSYRIKGSYKKATPFLRMLRELDLKEAITQCHFSSKRMARDVGQMLTRGIKEAKELGLNPDELYLNQIWVGKDGFNYRRLDFKARGKVGLIEHKWIHVRAILKPKSTKQNFLEAKRSREMARPLKYALRSKPIHVAEPCNDYKW